MGLLGISASARAGQDRSGVDGEQTSMQTCACSLFVELAVHVALPEAAGSPFLDLDGLYASDDRDQTQSACLPGPEVAALLELGLPNRRMAVPAEVMVSPADTDRLLSVRESDFSRDGCRSFAAIPSFDFCFFVPNCWAYASSAFRFRSLSTSFSASWLLLD